jgi:uncharacterized membrane protein YgcG
MRLWMGALVGACVSISSVFAAFELAGGLSFAPFSTYVNDVSSVLTLDQRIALSSSGETIERERGIQAPVVIFPELRGNDLFTVGMHLFEQNKIGDAKYDRGVLLLVVSSEKKLRIVT